MCACVFSHLDGRNSCRAPGGLRGSQGHLQGGPVPPKCLRLSAQLSFVSPSLPACLRGGRDSVPACPSFFFLQLRWGEGGKRGCSKHNAFRMCYLVWLQKGGEEPAPPFLCIDLRWDRSSCRTCGDGARGLQGPRLGQGLLHTRTLHPGLAWCFHVTVPCIWGCFQIYQGILKGSSATCLTRKKTQNKTTKCPTGSLLSFCLTIFGTAELIRFFLIHCYIINEVVWITAQLLYHLCLWKAIYY